MFEKMIADMLGISPAEMHEMLGGMQTMLKDGVNLLNRIEAKQDKILAAMNVPNDNPAPVAEKPEIVSHDNGS